MYCDRCYLLCAFRQKLLLWSRHIIQKKFANFFLLDKAVMEYNNLNLEKNFQANISQHLEGLRESFDGYFFLGDLEEQKTWIV